VTGKHNIQFAKLQDEYLATRDAKILNKMYLVCADLAIIYMRKQAFSLSHYIDFSEVAHESATYIICRYITKPDFKLTILSAYIFRCCNSAISQKLKQNKREIFFGDYIKEQKI
jgi:hypothetical protein